jgi:hypothetical protein
MQCAKYLTLSALLSFDPYSRQNSDTRANFIKNHSYWSNFYITAIQQGQSEFALGNLISYRNPDQTNTLLTTGIID